MGPVRWRARGGAQHVRRMCLPTGRSSPPPPPQLSRKFEQTRRLSGRLTARSRRRRRLCRRVWAPNFARGPNSAPPPRPAANKARRRRRRRQTRSASTNTFILATATVLLPTPSQLARASSPEEAPRAGGRGRPGSLWVSRLDLSRSSRCALCLCRSSPIVSSGCETRKRRPEAKAPRKLFGGFARRLRAAGRRCARLMWRFSALIADRSSRVQFKQTAPSC